MNRYFIFLEYDGTNYHGWQIQPNAITVQEVLEKGLSTIIRQPVAITGAGRTDTGVHAAAMVAHFDMEKALESPADLTERLNRILPYDIAIHKICRVKEDAHARFDAKSRTYEYTVSLRKTAFRRNQICKLHGHYDFTAMNDAASKLMNYTDFTSFSKLHTDVMTNNCRVTEAYWEERGEFWVFTITADRFLRNMVRAIVGTLLDVGRGKLSTDDFCRIIECCNRNKAGTSAPASGLSLINIVYEPALFTSP